ncbi:hypothetical protein B0H13DRAFT_1586918 [Mycena leptocephala]|nr:hypothetical protein B0H13DRAFT_1586918 [Mycena leptocephala]
MHINSFRIHKEDRLEVCVSTDEMKEVSWKYGYRSQIIVDGTFSVCDNRLLLFIVMGIDQNTRGVPLAFLFSTGNQQSSAGYDTDILAKLLKLWRMSLQKFRGGQSFYALVAITDTDVKKRAALRVFPGIILLVCKFHLRQSWRNHPNKLVKVKSPEHALSIIENERRVLTTWMETSHGAPAEKGLLHLDYLSSYWLSFDLWASWSDFGRYTAAEILGCDFEGVLPTTNYLKSFNGLLKRKYLRRWQRGGRRLRLQRAEQDHIAEWILSLPGGDRLLANKRAGWVDAPSLVAYFVADASRDTAAAQLLERNQISTPTFDADVFSFSCYSSFATELDPNPLAYEVELRINGTGSCNGPNFAKNGGANTFVLVCSR